MSPVHPLHQRGIRALALGLAVALAACNTGESSGGEPATSATTPQTSIPPGPRAAPRWETVTTLSGTGPLQSTEVAILPDAIQWRIRWNCDAGALRITSTPPPRRGGPLVAAGCPGKGEAFSIQTGRALLGVDASGPWKAIIDQQVEFPLDEPLTPELASAPVMAQGSFYRIERDGRGTARLHRLSDGRRVLRLEGFEVSQNTDLFVWLSEAPQPRTSVDAVSAPKVSIGNLRSTVGNQNYEVPSDIPTARIRSVVIWCEPVAIAYIAASLGS